MTSMYLWFKFLHVTAVMLWFGGAVAVAILSGRVAGRAGAEAASLVAEQSRIVGRGLIGPSALLTLVTGIVMVAMLGGPSAWIHWGVAVVLATGTSAAFLGRFSRELGQMRVAAVAAGAALGEGAGAARGGVIGAAHGTASGTAFDGTRERILRRRIALLGMLNLLLLLSAVWSMVIKPGA